MFDTPYNPCPKCRTNLKKNENVAQEVLERFPFWEFYNCPNCTSKVNVDPFAGIRERRANQVRNQ